MLCIPIITGTKFSCRYICTSAISQNKQTSRYINKLLKFNEKRISKPDASLFGKAVPSLSRSTTSRNPRRVTALNKIFMKHITDLMSTGEVGAKLTGKGIEITHIKVSPDYKLINVYWFAQKDEDVDSVEKLLHNCAGDLRRELIQLRVIGLIPPLYFVKDNNMTSATEVEQRLSVVDFGEDYTPSLQVKLKTNTVLKTTLHQEIREQINKLNDQDDDENNDDYHEIVLPEMPQDTLGLNHHSIMSKLKTSVNKMKTAQIQCMNLPPPSPITEDDKKISQEVLSFMSQTEENDLFTEFLKKRKIEEKRKKREFNIRKAKAEYEEEFMEAMKMDEADLHSEINFEVEK